MDRRNFLKGSSAFAALSFISGKSKVFAGTDNSDFSLEILTDAPGNVLELANTILPGIHGNNTILKQYKMYGKFTGDIVFIQNNQLFDFYRSNTQLALKLQAAAKKLNLPAEVKDPTLIRFSPNVTNTKPENLNIFVGNNLVERFNLEDEFQEHIITSNKGELVLNLAGRKAKVISSSCKHKTCMHKGQIYSSGENIVCIPNNIRIALEGSKTGIDAITE